RPAASTRSAARFASGRATSAAGSSCPNRRHCPPASPTAQSSTTPGSNDFDFHATDEVQDLTDDAANDSFTPVVFQPECLRVLRSRSIQGSVKVPGASRRMVMTNEDTLRALLDRIRAGDQQAATELVRRYEPALRRAVRLRLRNRQLRRVLDSSDICQAVLLRFFVRVATGRYDLDTPEKVLKLLATMARHQIVNEALH